MTVSNIFFKSFLENDHKNDILESGEKFSYI